MTALWDRASEAGRSAGRGYWGGLAKVDADRAEERAELESLRAEFRKLARERSELQRQRDEWRRRAERAEAMNRNRGWGSDE